MLQLGRRLRAAAGSEHAAELRSLSMLLQKHRDKIPKETYDYVFYIVSAAVIGENPRLFGFNFDNPLTNLNAQASANAELRRVTGRRSHRLSQHAPGAGLVGVVENRGQRVAHRCVCCLEALATMSHTWNAEKPTIRSRVVGVLPA